MSTLGRIFTTKSSLASVLVEQWSLHIYLPYHLVTAAWHGIFPGAVAYPLANSSRICVHINYSLGHRSLD